MLVWTKAGSSVVKCLQLLGWVAVVARHGWVRIENTHHPDTDEGMVSGEQWFGSLIDIDNQRS